MGQQRGELTQRRRAGCDALVADVKKRTDVLHIVRRSRSGSCRVFPHTPCTDLQLVNNSGTTCELLRRYSGTRFSAATDSPSLDCIQGERRTMTFRRSRAGTASSTPMSRRSSTVRAPAPRGITFPERDPADTDVFLSSDRWVRLKQRLPSGCDEADPRRLPAASPRSSRRRRRAPPLAALSTSPRSLDSTPRRRRPLSDPLAMACGATTRARRPRTTSPLSSPSRSARRRSLATPFSPVGFVEYCQDSPPLTLINFQVSSPQK